MESGNSSDISVPILLVDDSADNLLSLEAILGSLKQKLVRATSGEEALRRLLDEDFAVILLDVSMPGMNGLETAALIRGRARSHSTPIIFLTAYQGGELTRMQGYVSAGAADYLVKPIEPQVLRAKVGVFVEVYRQKHELQRQAELLRHSMNTITEERKRTEQERRRREDLEEFTHLASHDLREPLRAVSTFAQLLSQRYANVLDEDGKQFLGFVAEGAARVSRLIQNLVDYSNVSSDYSPIGPTDCERVLRDTLDELEQPIRESGAVIVHERLPVLPANAVQLRCVLQQLILNSIKFRKAGPPRIRIRANPGEHEWLFEISDDGIGFESEYAERIFLLFKRLHLRENYEGTGFGLAMCKRIIERHQGKIWAESSPGRGTTIFFTLPRGEPLPAARTLEPPSATQ